MDRFWAKVDKRGPDECWLWTGARTPKGYGTIQIDGKARKTAQVTWEIATGRPWTKGLHACHTCDNPPCVNPAHIWPGTCADNVRDRTEKGRGGGPCAANANKTHCPKGHELSEPNLYIRTRGHRTERYCRTCKIENKRKCRAALKGTSNVG